METVINWPMKYDFITIGGATRDIAFRTDKGVLLDNRQDVLRQKLLAFEYGAKIKVDRFLYAYGGGAANAAVCLANFGLRTACLAAVGDDENGRLISRNLKERGVEIRSLKTIARAESGASFILVDKSGERIIFGARGANKDLSLGQAEQRLLKQSRNIYIASLSGSWLANLKKIFAAAGKDGPRIFWNPGATQYAGGIRKIAPFVRKTTVFALNKDEAIELVLSSREHRHLSNSFLNKTDNLLKIIKGFGPQVVVITLGSQGVAAYDGRKIYRRPIVKEKRRVDTTGVGDVFNSSFAAGLERYRGDIGRALELGLKNTARKIRYFGAQNGLLKLRK